MKVPCIISGFAGKLGTILMSSADGIIQLVQLNMQERSKCV